MMELDGKNSKTLDSGNHQYNSCEAASHWNLEKWMHEKRTDPKGVQIRHGKESSESKYPRCWTNHLVQQNKTNGQKPVTPEVT